jgi:HlyD family secretion protein
MKRTILYLVLGVVIIAAVVGALVLRPWEAAAPEQETRSAVVERGTLLVAVSASGSIEPHERVNLTFDTVGRVVEVEVEVGDRVEADGVLAVLDTEQLELQVRQAEVALALAETQLDQLQADPRPEEIAAAEANVRAVQAQVDAAAANRDQLAGGPSEAQIAAAEAQVASAEFQWKIALMERDKAMEEYSGTKLEQAHYNYYTAEKALAAAQAQLDDLLAGADADAVRAAQANVEAATAQQDASQAQLDLLLAGATEEQVVDAEAQVAQAQAALESAELSLEQATLRAPFDGVVAEVNVTAGEMAPTGLPAVVLLDTSQFRLVVSVDEVDVGRLAVGQEVQVTVDALAEVELAGTVERIAPAATLEGGVVYYEILIRLVPTDAPIRADMTANATIVVEELSDVLTIPTWVVRVDRSTGETYVHRQVGPEGDEVERVEVALGVRHEGVAQVLDGLSEGDVLVWVEESYFDFGS